MSCSWWARIPPADGLRPCFDNSFDLNFGHSALLYHGSRSDYVPMDVPRTYAGLQIRHAEWNFMPLTCGAYAERVAVTIYF